MGNKKPLGIAIILYLALLLCLVPSGIPASPHYWQEVGNAPFSPRDTAEGVIFQDAMWLSNGYHVGGDSVRDLWRSENGLSWEEILSFTPYDTYSQLVVYGGKLWAVNASVWVSSDGCNWQFVANTPFGILNYAELLVFQDKLWVLGYGNSNWHTKDGIEWHQVSAPYGNRYAPAITVYRDRLWLLGGALIQPNIPLEKGYPEYTTLNDVWISPDGINWICLTEHAPWKPRMWAVAQEFNEQLWLVGGFRNKTASNTNTCWYTNNGLDWLEFEDTAYWKPRHAPTPYVFKDSLWIVAGNTNLGLKPLRNEVWRLPTPDLCLAS